MVTLARALGDGADAADRLLAETVGRVPGWAGRSFTYQPVGGGITNANYRVAPADTDETFFVKVPGIGTEMFIDRRAANGAARHAHGLGLGPRVHHFFEDTGIEVSAFVEGMRSCNNADFQRASIRAMAIDCYRRFNDGELLDLTKTVFDMIDEHADQVRSLDGHLPDDFAWLDWQYRRARAALDASGLDLVPCFNDPMPMNFMIDGGGTRMLLIDFEYASNNDRCYELGIWFGEMFFTEAIEHELIECYFGRVDASIVARCQIHKALADIKWGLWSSVQEKLSALDFDFSKYGAWKFMRARSVMHDTRWEGWLRQA
jgi:thiamine kinase-like enzyme